MDIQKEIARKGFDIAKVVSYAIKNPQSIEQLIEGVTAPKGSTRFAYEKVLRFISEERPDLIYPYFDVFKKLSVCDNSFLKWGAILTIANLAAADTDEKFDAMFDEYYAPVKGPVMVTASSIIGGSVKIVQAKPYLSQKITKEILKVEKARYEYHGELSSECRNVAIGQAIDTFDQLFDELEDKEAIIKFVKKQLKNTRQKVVKKAEKFLKKHAN
ncbi:MAG: hypothetical protein JXA96_14760 [Sedimentisphaerales bacterium]|nr:hypothetical protein [Sedimentisphaerales bacterium]